MQLFEMWLQWQAFWRLFTHACFMLRACCFIYICCVNNAQLKLGAAFEWNVQVGSDLRSTNKPFWRS